MDPGVGIEAFLNSPLSGIGWGEENGSSRFSGTCEPALLLQGRRHPQYVYEKVHKKACPSSMSFCTF